MNFIGSDCKFNNILRENITIKDYTIVSNIDGDYTNQIIGDKIILLLPINSTKDYLNNTAIACSYMKDSSFESLKVYTSIFLYMYEHIDINQVIDTINNFDKHNLVDNIWIYPKLINHIMRDNTVKNLPWQKQIITSN